MVSAQDSDRAVRVRALTRAVCCVLEQDTVNITVIVLLSTQVYKWVPVTLLLIQSTLEDLLKCLYAHIKPVPQLIISLTLKWLELVLLMSNNLELFIWKLLYCVSE